MTDNIPESEKMYCEICCYCINHECHRRAPAASNTGEAVFPRVNQNIYCGECQPSYEFIMKRIENYKKGRMENNEKEKT
jgi:hypothetical protein